DKCDEILKQEGLLSRLNVPLIDISDWKRVFESLQRLNQNIIVEKQTINDQDSEFVIGRIVEIYKNFAYVWNFDADGTWEDSPIRVPYSEITNVTFASRYVEIFSKYISEPPLFGEC
ncbi:MAG TPA: hypothetical protein VHY08_27445, partial [Bacillota bacterium]|nr:hypothetical protein [Bacillota bacterium]